MLAIVPSVLVLMGRFDVWVPKRLIESRVGAGSGPQGMCLALLLGTAAAGPLYAAFPVARALQQEGARLANFVTFLAPGERPGSQCCSWRPPTGDPSFLNS